MITEGESSGQVTPGRREKELREPSCREITTYVSMMSMTIQCGPVILMDREQVKPN